MKSIKIMLVALGLIMLIVIVGISSLLNAPGYALYENTAYTLLVAMIIVGGSIRNSQIIGVL